MPQEFHPHNLNDRARVKPTALGLRLIETKRRELTVEVPAIDWSVWRKTDADGWLEIELWEVMRLFGPHIRMGGEPPIETQIQIKWCGV